jgi:hypothetical protein
MAILRPLTKAQYEVSFTALSNAGAPAATFVSVFTQFSGINDTADSNTYANGTGNRLYHVVGPRTADNITLTAPYDPSIFKSLEQFWLDYNCNPITVTVTPTSCDGSYQQAFSGFATVSGQYICYECQFVSITTADVDRESGDVQTIEIELTVNYWERT